MFHFKLHKLIIYYAPYLFLSLVIIVAFLNDPPMYWVWDEYHKPYLAYMSLIFPIVTFITFISRCLSQTSLKLEITSDNYLLITQGATQVKLDKIHEIQFKKNDKNKLRPLIILQHHYIVFQIHSWYEAENESEIMFLLSDYSARNNIKLSL